MTTAVILPRADHADIATCVRCHRPIRWGRPYVMVAPGLFAHRGPCVVVR